jgi:2-polyprenyl-3-methyl-5-hydroxy-6-metoxy-1,4-benzoquinol methylase
MDPEEARSEPKSIANVITRPFAWLAAGIGWRARAWSQEARDVKLGVEAWVRHSVGLNQPEKKLISDSQNYWNSPSNKTYEQDSHWRGGGIFADDSRWIALGREHVRIYEEFARAAALQQPIRRVTEWGCGGGMNAIHFGQLADEFCGIDIAQASLEECAKQMELAGLHNFAPVLIDASDPEAALARVSGPCDLFICTYVFEVLPSPEYGIRVLRVAHQLMVPGGMAIVQIKYNDDWKTSSRMWNYAKNLAWHATYRIEEFWQAAEQCGFTPKMVTLVPKQTQIIDRNYAYFLLVKPAAT